MWQNLDPADSLAPKRHRKPEGTTAQSTLPYMLRNKQQLDAAQQTASTQTLPHIVQGAHLIQQQIQARKHVHTKKA
jgi:hypothetical protein